VVEVLKTLIVSAQSILSTSSKGRVKWRQRNLRDLSERSLRMWQRRDATMDVLEEFHYDALIGGQSPISATNKQSRTR